ncbi:hypothetical protein VC83_01156 [Pseudogymnoascus destructans]|uniref:Uncharacterized protein n=1 Tax=Pseudogymnoascus destructans TaxID=655981 RepID=A0A177AKP2_9PEZI|nr:uncharacterized protein VC83_01156 [Pseudogymnoascus destructans]OAF62370.1 hypothetical protein VC83_01156 [Pseudogymnoascus destructans]
MQCACMESRRRHTTDPLIDLDQRRSWPQPQQVSMPVIGDLTPIIAGGQQFVRSYSVDIVPTEAKAPRGRTAAGGNCLSVCGGSQPSSAFTNY